MLHFYKQKQLFSLLVKGNEELVHFIDNVVEFVVATEEGQFGAALTESGGQVVVVDNCPPYQRLYTLRLNPQLAAHCSVDVIAMAYLSPMDNKLSVFCCFCEVQHWAFVTHIS